MLLKFYNFYLNFNLIFTIFAIYKNTELFFYCIKNY